MSKYRIVPSQPDCMGNINSYGVTKDAAEGYGFITVEKWFKTRYEAEIYIAGKKLCTCPQACDCQDPDGKATKGELCLISNSCPIHNLLPDPDPECPIHS
jgi:hypothetical protein